MCEILAVLFCIHEIVPPLPCCFGVCLGPKVSAANCLHVNHPRVVPLSQYVDWFEAMCAAFLAVLAAGIPISLSIVYMEVAARLGLKMAGVNLPAHFMIRPQVRCAACRSAAAAFTATAATAHSADLLYSCVPACVHG
jgi:hypothetical protein